MKEHNDNICDHIIAEIRNSRLLVADFTGQRGGVYFEAGFAYGIGIPVIWTCHEDWFNKEAEIEVDAEVDGMQKKVLVKQPRFTHFDVNHYNFIVWKNEIDLYEKLKNRILATVPIK
jgi:nucleoside 2-deoxyribosyltransferase